MANIAGSHGTRQPRARRAGPERVAERLGQTAIATLNHRDFRVVRPKHCEAFELLPAPGS